jgi:uncharacterized membrane protein HdeD (DUF308 family)
MKKLKQFYLKAEQLILFYSLVIYLMGFIFIFDEDVVNTGWMGLILLVQFIILILLLVKKSKQKGWMWPSRP